CGWRTGPAPPWLSDPSALRACRWPSARAGRRWPWRGSGASICSSLGVNKSAYFPIFRGQMQRKMDLKTKAKCKVSCRNLCAVWRSVDQPVAQVDDALGVAGHLRFVRDQDDRQPLLAVELLEHVEDLDAGARVEVAGRLVGEEEGGVVDEGAGDGDALL